MTETYVSIAEAARLLGTSERTVQAWAKEGLFPNAYKLNPTKKNSPYRIPKADIEAVKNKRLVHKALDLT